jgi:hypothetical protein
VPSKAPKAKRENVYNNEGGGYAKSPKKKVTRYADMSFTEGMVKRYDDDKCLRSYKQVPGTMELMTSLLSNLVLPMRDLANQVRHFDEADQLQEAPAPLMHY